MATFVGQTGSTLHYADTLITWFGTKALHVEVRTFSRGEPHVAVHDIGHVFGGMDVAVDRVAEIVRRKRELFDLLAGGKS